MIYVMIASKAEMRERDDMIMKTHKLVWNMMFSNQKSGVSGMFHDLGPVIL